MNDQPNKPPPAAAQDREARLAKALRDNLRRRKAGAPKSAKGEPAKDVAKDEKKDEKATS